MKCVILKLGGKQSETVENVGLEFQWDTRKAKENLRKHSVSFQEAITVFSDFLSLTIPDPLHSEAEDRLITIGHSEKQQLLVVVHTVKR